MSALAAAVALLLAIGFMKPDPAFVSRAQALPDESAPTMTLGRAWLPYILLSILVMVWGSAWALPFLNTVSMPVDVPLLHNAVERVPPVTAAVSRYPAVFNFNWLSTAGTATFLAAVLAARMTGIGLAQFARIMWGVLKRLFVPLMTIAAVLALAYVMNYSGATATLGLTLAGTGIMFPFFSAFLGWLGVFLTGSDTSGTRCSATCR